LDVEDRITRAYIKSSRAGIRELTFQSRRSQKLRWLYLQAQETALLIIPLKMKTGSASRMVSNTSVFGVTRALMEI